MARPRLFLIDGSSQMYRAYHAMRGGGLSNQEGSTTHAVYLFVTMLRKLMADHAPPFIAASFDLAGKTFRDDIVSDYKANRAAMPDDLAEQIGWVHEACEAMGVPILTSRGYEADDVIGTLAVKAVATGYDVAIVSIDKDFFQLVVDPQVKVYDPREDGTWFDEAGVVQKFGVKPSQVVDVLALVGDTSDNVAGVPGIGKKGAIDLITRFESLDALLDGAASQLKGKQRDTLIEHRSDALQSRELVTIRTDVPLEVDLATLAYRGASREKCYDLFTRLAFRTLINDYAPSMDSTPHEYQLITTDAAFDALVAQLTEAREFGLRLTTDDVSAVRAAIVGFAFSVADRRAAYVPVGHESGNGSHDLLSAASRPAQLELKAVLERLTPLFEDASLRKIGHDLKQEVILLARHGVTLRGVGFDSMLGSYLLDATRSSHALPEVALEHLGYKAIAQESVVGKGVKAVNLSSLTPETALTLACERVDVGRQLARKLEPMLDDELASVNRDLELPLVDVLADIERAGIRVDTTALAEQSKRLDSQLASLTARIHDLAGGDFNISSPKQLGEVLFERLNLPGLKKTGKTKSFSTAVEVLEELALTHELPKLILEYRGLHKLKGTYVDALPLLVNPATGRVHTSLNQAVAATGRLSSSDPNLQNIPIRTEIGREIRSAFVAAPGCVLISADYSQIELRVLAHLAEEDTLIEAFRVGEDIHDRTALKVFGADSGLSKHELRRRAKIINYALLYGKTAFTLAKDIGVTKEAAQAFIDAYFAGFPKVRNYIDVTIEEARKTGVVKTMFGRRRLVPELNSRNGQIRMGAERETINMPIQGTAADILKRAMIDIHAALSKPGTRTRMILTVHDELLFECPAEEADESSALVQRLMQNAVKLAVPLDVDVGHADNWRDAKA